MVASRLISRPTTAKKIAIAASLTQWCRSRSMPHVPMWKPAVVDQSASYASANGELAQTRAMTVAASR